VSKDAERKVVDMVTERRCDDILQQTTARRLPNEMEFDVPVARDCSTPCGFHFLVARKLIPHANLQDPELG
jgi:hypothetical protein